MESGREVGGEKLETLSGILKKMYGKYGDLFFPSNISTDLVLFWPHRYVCISTEWI